ncbi:MAG: YceD family protein [Nevskiales bacterium]|nr:YceD family protein [Nevskiales bacterium]
MGIPNEVRASAAVEQEMHFVGCLEARAMPRLQAQLAPGTDAAVDVDLRTDARAGWPRLHGTVSGELPVECRRCERSFAWPLRLTVDLRLVRSEDEERKALADADPLWVRDDRLMLRELVEDEVLLAMPMLPRCESCENAILSAPQASPVDAPSERENPFAALKQHFKDKSVK